VTNSALHQYVQDRLAGDIATPGGKTLAGHQLQWTGRRHGAQATATLVTSLAPGADREPIVDLLPRSTSMRISHEATYQALYVQGRGTLRRELTACLGTGRALRVPRYPPSREGLCDAQGSDQRASSVQRPACVEDRAMPVTGKATSSSGWRRRSRARPDRCVRAPTSPGSEPVLYCACPHEASAARAAVLANRVAGVRARPLAGGLEAWIVEAPAARPASRPCCTRLTALSCPPPAKSM